MRTKKGKAVAAAGADGAENVSENNNVAENLTLDEATGDNKDKEE